MRNRLVLSVAAIAALVGAFGFGAQSAQNNGRLFQWMQKAKSAATGQGAKPITETPAYIARKSVFEVSAARSDVVMIGDSITQGGEWAEQFPGVRIANRGIGSDTTTGMLARIDSILSLQPRKALILAGVNDLANKEISDQDLLKNYHTLIRQLRQSGAKVVVQSTLLVSKQPLKDDINPRIQALNASLQRHCEAGHCTFEDLNDDLAPAGMLDSSVTWDGIHLNGKGYAIWTEQIRKHITAEAS